MFVLRSTHHLAVDRLEAQLRLAQEDRDHWWTEFNRAITERNDALAQLATHQVRAIRGAGGRFVKRGG